MNRTTTRSRTAALVIALLVALSLLAGCHRSAPVVYTQAPRPLNIIQRHPTASSLVAGYAAYKAAKVTGQNRDMAGRNKNFAQRHPFLTGAAAAGLAHHMIKKSVRP